MLPLHRAACPPPFALASVALLVACAASTSGPAEPSSPAAQPTAAGSSPTAPEPTSYTIGPPPPPTATSAGEDGHAPAGPSERPASGAWSPPPGTPPAVAELMATDRQKLGAPRARTLLITELQGLERLYRTLPAAERPPALVKRLAVTYLELEASALLGPDGGSDPRARKIAQAAAQKAVTYYSELLAR